MSTINRPLTADDLWNMPAHGGRRELVKGRLREVMSPTGLEHQIVLFRLARRLANFVEDNDLGHIGGAEGGYLIERNPDTVLAPDIAYTSHGRLSAHGITKQYLPAAPDLVVEIESPSDRKKALREKAAQWINAGVRLVWIVHPESRTVDIFQPATKAQKLCADQRLDGGEVLPGFSCLVDEIFVPVKRT